MARMRLTRIIQPHASLWARVTHPRTCSSAPTRLPMELLGDRPPATPAPPRGAEEGGPRGPGEGERARPPTGEEAPLPPGPPPVSSSSSARS